MTLFYYLSFFILVIFLFPLALDMLINLFVSDKEKEKEKERKKKERKSHE